MNAELPDDFSELEAELRAVRPVAPSAGFADRVAVESRLRAVRPRPPSAGFADRVVAASVREPSALLRFPVRIPFPARLALGATAAFALAALAISGRPGAEPVRAPGPVAVAAHTRPVAPVPAARPAAPTLWAVADDGSVLPVVNLSDGRVYRPRVLRSDPAPTGFRAMPGGAVMPVSYGTGPAAIEYSPVEYE